MLNQVVLVGRLTSDLKVEKSSNGKEIVKLKIAIPRSYKNEEGVYDTDFITCHLWGEVAKNTAEYCKKADIIGIKGRLEEYNGRTTVQAERVTFLSSSKRGDEDKC